MEILKYTMENIKGRKSRSLLTILSIFIGVSAIFIFASFGYGLYDYVEELKESSGIDQFMVTVAGMSAPGLTDTFKLGESDLRTIRRVRGVDFVTYWYMKPAQIDQGSSTKYVYLAGLEPNEEALSLLEDWMGVDIAKGREFQKSDTGKVLLGYNFMIDDKIMPEGYEVGDKIEINNKKFRIIGFFESIGNPQDDSNVYMLEDDVLDLFGADTPYGMILGSVRDAGEIEEVIERVKKDLRTARGQEEGKEDFFVQSFADQFEIFNNVMFVVLGFIGMIVVISAIVASINTSNTMVTSVLERVQEIGIMKSLGATNKTIRNIFLLESSILGFISGLIGILIGWGLASIGGRILNNLGWGFLSPTFTWWMFFGCVFLATLVGSLSGMFPAIYASKQNVVDALHYE